MIQSSLVKLTTYNCGTWPPPAAPTPNVDGSLGADEASHRHAASAASSDPRLYKLQYGGRLRRPSRDTKNIFYLGGVEEVCY